MAAFRKGEDPTDRDAPIRQIEQDFQAEMGEVQEALDGGIVHGLAADEIDAGRCDDVHGGLRWDAACLLRKHDSTGVARGKR